MKSADAMGWAPLRANGCTYWLTHHAADRALEMGVPLKLIPAILENGTWYDAPEHSKYKGTKVVRSGKVSLGVKYTNEHGWIIQTVLWATVEGWRGDTCRDRTPRKEDATIIALTAWLKGEVVS